MATLDERARARMTELESAQRLRQPPRVDGPQADRLHIDGRSLVSLCSNNYLSLADHPDLVAAARRSLDTEGLGAAASRLVSGTMAAHEDLETRLARHLGLPDAVLFSTGYAANVGTLSALVGRADVAFSDALNHASLIDGLRLARTTVHVYRHRDAAHLESLLRAHRADGRAAVVVTDSVFSMDGDEADLPTLRALASAHDAALIVDEAHAFGVLGPAGRGLAAEQGVEPDLLTLGFGKATGVAGGAAAGSADVCRWLRHDARSYVFSTAPLPLQARAAARALDLLAGADDARARLLRSAERLRAGLADAGYRVGPGRTPIVPVLVGPEEDALALSRHLRDRGFLVQAIRPPTVPPGTSRLRLVPTAAHDDATLDALLEAFRAAPAALRGTGQP